MSWRPHLILFLFAFPSAAAEVRPGPYTFTVPDGFTVEQVAASPLVDRPIVADFDEQGRLYVADSSGSNAPVAEQVKNPTHRIVRLEDVDGDGRFDRRTVFADRMMFPEGAMWHEGALYVSAPPSIWKLTDTDGDGVADRREEWFRGKTLTGCANDLHGPYLGPDGRIYWCKGAPAQQTYERPGKPPLVTRAAHIFRARVDGTGIEPVMTGGMDNPVEVAFTPGGERIFTTTFLQEPGGGLRDGLIHDVYGAIYGKVRGGLEGHPRTDREVMPVLVHLGAAAPSGLARYESDAFGQGFRDNLFAALFNLRKVTRHVLRPEGSTFRATTEDFLAATDRDFHPTDVLEDADGSLLVLDTGGWYKLCCPTSQLPKPEVLGSIYRIRRTDAPRPHDPRGLALAWPSLKTDDLAGLLDDPRPAVRRRAILELGKHGVPAIPVLAEVIRVSRSAEARRNAVWAATRIDHADARDAVRTALGDGDESVQQAALNSTSLWRDGAAVPSLLVTLNAGLPAARRVAAEALGRIGGPQAVPALLDAAATPADRPLEHALTFALIEIAAPAAVGKGRDSANPSVRRTALIALDQMPGGQLPEEAVIPLLAAGDPKLREAASWIVGRHPEWAKAVARTLRDRLAGVDALGSAERLDFERQLGEFAGTEPVQLILAESLIDPEARPEARSLILRALARSGLKHFPGALGGSLATLVGSREEAVARQAVATVRTSTLDPARDAALVAALVKRGTVATGPADLRLASLSAVPAGVITLGPDLFEFLRGQLAPDLLVTQRLVAADVLTRARSSPDQLEALTADLRDAGPILLDRLLPGFDQAKEDRVGLALVSALKAPPLPAGLRPDALRPHLEHFGPEVKAAAEPLYAALDAADAAQRGRLDTLLASLGAGDVHRGRAVFNGTKAACVTCHAIGYLGGKVGPDLTNIGEVRAPRDLLESIAFPSASFVRSFEPVIVATRDGRVASGILRKDDPQEIVLTTGAEQEARIPRGEIDEMRPGTVSVMPAGLDQQLSPQELADLLAFLQACK